MMSTHSSQWLRPRRNVELFMRQTKLVELSSWKVRRLAQLLSSSEWVCIVQHVLFVCFRRIKRLKIVSGTNVDLHMQRTCSHQNHNPALIQWVTCRCWVSNSWKQLGFWIKIQKTKIKRKSYSTLGNDEIQKTITKETIKIHTCRNVRLARWEPIKGKNKYNLNSNNHGEHITHPTTT